MPAALIAMPASAQPTAAPTLGWAGAPEAAPVLRVEAVYEAHVDYVWKTARRLGAQPWHVDDVVQEVFVVVQRRLADFAGRSELKTWLFGITRHVVRAHLRQHARQRRDRAALDDIPELADLTTPNAEARLAKDEDKRLLYSLLAELDEDKRAVFVLSELEEMSGPAIAQALELPLSNVYARVRSARLAFEAALRRHRAHSEGAR